MTKLREEKILEMFVIIQFGNCYHPVEVYITKWWRQGYVQNNNFTTILYGTERRSLTFTVFGNNVLGT